MHDTGESEPDGRTGPVGRARKYLRANLFPRPEGKEGIERYGHRAIVGGLWDVIGPLQFDFMKQQGLEPAHVLLDVGCGSFRAGRFFIEFLDAGNYLAIDKDADLIAAGKREEVGSDLWERKAPEVVVSAKFAFDRFSKAPQFAIANSLFTHLRMDDIDTCLRRLRSIAAPSMQFYASFNPVPFPLPQFWRSHSHRLFGYTVGQLGGAGASTGWQAEFVGDWGHPRDLQMMRFTAA